jgi:hypothetical protein
MRLRRALSLLETAAQLSPPGGDADALVCEAMALAQSVVGEIVEPFDLGHLPERERFGGALHQAWESLAASAPHMDGLERDKINEANRLVGRAGMLTQPSWPERMWPHVSATLAVA